MHILQQQILELARAEDLAQNSIRAVARKIGAHPQAAKYHLDQLVKSGLLGRDDEAARYYLEENSDSSLINIPILGAANCGEALLAADEQLIGYLKLSPSVVDNSQRRMFAVKAVGNSMNQASLQGKTIQDGDYVLVDSQRREPSNGDIVLSTIEGAANIKRFFRDEPNSQIVLMAQSTYDHPPIVIDQTDEDSFLVNGLVTQVIKIPGV